MWLLPTHWTAAGPAWSLAPSRTRPEPWARTPKAYRRLFGPLVPGIGKAIPTILGPLRYPPAHPLATARLALPGLLPASWVARLFKTEEARGLLAGAAAHSLLALDQPLTGSFALLFVALGHTYGWPVVEGGSGRLVEALVAELASVGAEFHVGHGSKASSELGRPKAALMDISARQMANLVGSRATPVLTGTPRAVPLRRREYARSTGP